MRLVVVVGDADGVDKEVVLETVDASEDAEDWLGKALTWAAEASAGPAGDGEEVSIIDWRLA